MTDMEHFFREHGNKLKVLLFVSMLISVVLFFASMQELRSASGSDAGISYGHNTLKVSTDRYLTFLWLEDESRALFIDRENRNRLIIPLGSRYKLASVGEDEIEFDITESNNIMLLFDDPAYSWSIMNETEFIRHEVKVKQLEGESIENLSSKVLMASDLEDGRIQILDKSVNPRSGNDYYCIRLADGNESGWFAEIVVENGFVVVKEEFLPWKYLLDKSGQKIITSFYEEIAVVDGEVYGLKGPEVSPVKVYDSAW